MHPGIFIPVGGYQFNETIANFGTDPSATLSFSGSAASGDFYDGSIRSLRGSIGYRKGRNLTWTGSWARNFIELPVGDCNTDLVGLLSTSSTGLYVVFNTANLTRDYLDPHDAQRRTLSRALFVKFNYLLDY